MAIKARAYDTTSDKFVLVDFPTSSASVNGFENQTAGVAITAPALVSFNSSGAVILADSVDAVPARGVVTSSATNGATNVTVFKNGTVITGLSGLTANADYYLSISGTWSVSGDVDAGHILQRIGYAKSATELVIEIIPAELNQ